jgi:hypothetical protein
LRTDRRFSGTKLIPPSNNSSTMSELSIRERTAFRRALDVHRGYDYTRDVAAGHTPSDESVDSLKQLSLKHTVDRRISASAISSDVRKGNLTAARARAIIRLTERHNRRRQAEADAAFVDLGVEHRRTEAPPEPIARKSARVIPRPVTATEKLAAPETNPFDVFCQNVQFQTISAPEVRVIPARPPKSSARRTMSKKKGASVPPPVALVESLRSRHMVFIDPRRLGSHEVIDFDAIDFMEYLGERVVSET